MSVKTTFLFFLAILTPVLGLRIQMSPEMTLSDFYRQGIYPVRSGQDEIMIWSDPIEFVFSENHSLNVNSCRARFSISVSERVLLCQYYDEKTYSLEKGVRALEQMALDIGVDLHYQRFPPEIAPSASGVTWTRATGKMTSAPSGWVSSLVARRNDETLKILGELSGPADVRELAAATLEWGSTRFVKSPGGWEHLPLGFFDRGDHPEVRAFTFLVSSYDDEGNLLPEFAKLRKEIEQQASLKAGQREQASHPRRRSNPPPRAPIGTPPDEENLTVWILAALGLLLMSAGFYLIRKLGQS